MVSDFLPDFLVTGEPARLFPVGSESSKEVRAVSVFLACLKSIPDLSTNLLATVGVRLGTRAKIRTFTEIGFKGAPGDGKDRPDGLIIVESGQKRWMALVEAKIGGAELKYEQIEKYGEIAKSNKIDAIITISNQFVALPDHHPFSLPRSISNHVNLFHWSWQSILTETNLLDIDNKIEDPDQAFILSEFSRFLEHDSTGVATFNQMNKVWREVLKNIEMKNPIRKSDGAIQNTLGAWFEEQRDLCLLMTRHLVV
jgi:hypothetical protein